MDNGQRAMSNELRIAKSKQRTAKINQRTTNNMRPLELSGLCPGPHRSLKTSNVFTGPSFSLSYVWPPKSPMTLSEIFTDWIKPLRSLR
jgi:hypothetical protein